MVRPASLSCPQACKTPQLRANANTVLTARLNIFFRLLGTPGYAIKYTSFRELSKSRHDELIKTDRSHRLPPANETGEYKKKPAEVGAKNVDIVIDQVTQ